MWFWLSCAVRVLFDGAFAARVWNVADGMAAPPEPQVESLPAPEQEAADEPDESEITEKVATSGTDTVSALVLLGLLQREGRLIDFVEQDINEFDDAEIGAAARVVQQGCRKALRAHLELEPVRGEDEDSAVEVSSGIDTGAIKLTGNVRGKPPYRGALRHKGWRVTRLTLPTPVEGHDVRVVAAAEVEL